MGQRPSRARTPHGRRRPRYTVPGDPRRSAVTVTTADPYATVAVQPGGPGERTVIVTVTSEDGARTREYHFTFAR